MMLQRPIDAGDIHIGSTNHHLTFASAQAGRITSWIFAGNELMTSVGSDPVEFGCYPMAPWCGRITDNRMPTAESYVEFPETYGPWALHGLVYRNPAHVISHDEKSVVFAHDIGDPWPVASHLTSAWRIDGNRVVSTLTLRTQAGSFPAVIGLHPWFRRNINGTSAMWSTECTQQLERGTDHLPTGNVTTLLRDGRSFDDAFFGARASEIRWPGLLALHIHNSHDWFVVYDGNPHAVCIEPQTGPPDFARLTYIAPLNEVTPDAPLVMTTQWTLNTEGLAS